MKVLVILRSLGAAVSLGLLVSGCGASHSSSSSLPAVQVPGQSIAVSGGRTALSVRPATFNAPLLPPTGTIYIGAYVNPSGKETPAEQVASTAQLETSIGRKFAIDNHYHIWSDTLNGVGEQDDLTNHRIPLLSWDCDDGPTSGVKDADIAAGLYDASIAKRAITLKNFGAPVFMRWKWEMNLVHHAGCADPAHDIVDKYGKTHYSPKEFIAAWNHMRAVFIANGATNVVWIWNPSGNGIVPKQYYPGDSQVDWVGFDWYDSFNLYFLDIYDLTFNSNTQRIVWTYPYLSKTFPSKPLMIGETGAVQIWQQQYFLGDSTHPSADQALQSNLQNIKAYIYWDSQGGRGNYQILSSGLPAFTQFVNGPYESGMAP